MSLSPQNGHSRRNGYSGTLSSSSPAVALSEISRVYGSGEAMVRACDRISLNIHPGEYCAIMGESGSGKTTLMNIIGCLDQPTNGRYWLDGVDVSRLGKNQLARIRNQKIGFVFQRYELLNNLSALENVMLPMMYMGIDRKQRRRLAAAALRRMGLGQRLDKRPTQLSGGQQQRVAIARAIVNRPLLLLADEPTGALDTHSAEAVMAIFSELHKSGITIIMVTHSHDVAGHSKRIIQVSDGRILGDSTSTIGR
ncbi:ABC transporter ATP-binding protein [Oscillatoria sp. CS-180]|uniref:ABC transporter ATP-binding protein n=1 Tax=Oscillatoria sp. CS-180 TaxID=3021720 RepID=UPI00232CFDE0|nr:ABC transporter ATP-binding protein [Oscillatoria sp. CS-180]MDB9528281.1 ABC transporter ATP-binding protein [Oscillatoria sp. CS-180]